MDARHHGYSLMDRFPRDGPSSGHPPHTLTGPPPYRLSHDSSMQSPTFMQHPADLPSGHASGFSPYSSPEMRMMPANVPHSYFQQRGDPRGLRHRLFNEGYRYAGPQQVGPSLSTRLLVGMALVILVLGLADWPFLHRYMPLQISTINLQSPLFKSASRPVVCARTKKAGGNHSCAEMRRCLCPRTSPMMRVPCIASISSPRRTLASKSESLISLQTRAGETRQKGSPGWLSAVLARGRSISWGCL